jgi:hypothetical protein
MSEATVRSGSNAASAALDGLRHREQENGDLDDIGRPRYHPHRGANSYRWQRLGSKGTHASGCSGYSSALLAYYSAGSMQSRGRRW